MVSCGFLIGIAVMGDVRCVCSSGYVLFWRSMEMNGALLSYVFICVFFSRFSCNFTVQLGFIRALISLGAL